MEALLVIGLMAAVAVALHLVSPSKVDWTGPVTLSNELQKRGIPLNIASRDFYEECTDLARQAATRSGPKRSKQKEAFTREIQRIAGTLALWRRDPGHPAFSPQTGELSVYRILFERHGL